MSRRAILQSVGCRHWRDREERSGHDRTADKADTESDSRESAPAGGMAAFTACAKTCTSVAPNQTMKLALCRLTTAFEQLSAR
jgi:hypothetical protein